MTPIEKLQKRANDAYALMLRCRDLREALLTIDQGYTLMAQYYADHGGDPAAGPTVSSDSIKRVREMCADASNAYHDACDEWDKASAQLEDAKRQAGITPPNTPPVAPQITIKARQLYNEYSL